MSEKIAISVKNVSKSFRLPHERQGSVKNIFMSFFKGKTSYEKQEVLKDISFEIKKGEFFGIVGRNGSGKSTLLKLLAGIYSQDKGCIQVNGKLVPFIELGVGFNPELTGRENVFLNGALLGFDRKQMELMYDEIVAFAELERFMDQKLKNYSSGMQVRLAFSIAIRSDGDVLLLDEVLAVGDQAFQRKCYKYFAQLKRNKKTVVLVTHDMDAVSRFCSRAMLISNGEIVDIGDVSKITKKYNEINRTSEEKASGEKTKKIKTGVQIVSLNINLVDQEGKERKSFKPGDKLCFEAIIKSKETLSDIIFGLTIERSTGDLVYWFTTEPPNPTIGDLINSEVIKLNLEVDNIFGQGDYSVNVSIKSRDRSSEHLIINGALKFEVIVDGKFGWMLQPRRKSGIIRGPVKK